MLSPADICSGSYLVKQPDLSAWPPDTMIDPCQLNPNSHQSVITTALEDNFWAYILALHAKAEDRVLLDINTLLLVSTGIVGRSILPRDEEKVKFVIELIKTYFIQLSIGVSWWITPNAQPDNLSALLQESGFRLERKDQGMVINLKDYKHSILIPEKFTVKSVDSLASLQDYTQILAEHWNGPNPQFIQETYLDSKERFLLPQMPLRLYVGYYQGKPVTAGELFFGNGLAGIYSVTTSKTMRRQGYAGGLVSALLLYAVQNGYQLATLLSLQQSKKLYSSLGFQELCTFYEFRSS